MPLMGESDHRFDGGTLVSMADAILSSRLWLAGVRLASVAATPICFPVGATATHEQNGCPQRPKACRI
jgi:hypothetical protein